MPRFTPVAIAVLPFTLGLALLGCVPAELATSAESAEPVEAAEAAEPTAVATEITLDPQPPAAPTRFVDWHFPSDETHEETLHLESASRPLRLVRGEAYYSGNETSFRCPEPMEFEDLIIGVPEDGTSGPVHILSYKVGTGPDVYPPHFSARKLLRGRRAITVERGVRGNDHRQTLVANIHGCGTLEIETHYVSPRQEIDYLAWEDFAYARTLLATEEPIYTSTFHGLSFLSLIPTAAPLMTEDQRSELQRLRRLGGPMPASGCRGFLILPASHFDYLQLCSDLGFVGCYLQLRQIDANGRHYIDDLARPRNSPLHWEDLPDERFDLDRYLRGVSLNFDVGGHTDMPMIPEHLGSLSRSNPELGTELIRRVQDPKLDEFHRVSALIALFSSPITDEDLRARLLAGDLSPLSRELLDTSN